jgi:hypothetical protein
MKSPAIRIRRQSRFVAYAAEMSGAPSGVAVVTSAANRSSLAQFPLAGGTQFLVSKARIAQTIVASEVLLIGSERRPRAHWSASPHR